ncbi:MAG: hypothetical protein JWO15_3742 [Sphingomonadales bacterium]|nr:hypothetical protein [Sphingomonadales bacterium]
MTGVSSNDAVILADVSALILETVNGHKARAIASGWATDNAEMMGLDLHHGLVTKLLMTPAIPDKQETP